MSSSVKFSTTAGEPTIIHVTDEDGRKFDLQVRVVVFDVLKTDETSTDGLPVFQAKAQIVTLTNEVKS